MAQQLRCVGYFQDCPVPKCQMQQISNHLYRKLVGTSKNSPNKDLAKSCRKVMNLELGFVYCPIQERFIACETDK